MAQEHDETERRPGENPASEDATNDSPAKDSSEVLADTKTETADEPSEPESDAASTAIEERAALPAKKKKKSAKTQTAEIRDRNQRVRAEAADKRRGKRDGARSVKARDLDATEVMDDALARSTHAAASFFKRHFNVLQWIVLGGVAIWVGYVIYDWRHDRTVDKESDLLLAAVTAEHARIGTGEAAPDNRTGLVDSRVAFETTEKRAKKALEAYREAAKGSGGMATLAKLGIAGVLYDQSKYVEAQKAYQEVKDSKLASQDKDVKGRALEGLGMTAEALKKKDEAQKAYRELENLDTQGFVILGMYHQARVHHASGESEKAKELLKKAQEKIKKAETDKKPIATSFLSHSVTELLKTIDPKAVTPPAFDPSMLEGMDMGGDPAKAQRLQELLKQMQQKQPPAAPGNPVPASGGQ